MRIAILNWRDSSHPQAGGAEAVVEHECLGLSQLGHEVTLFTSRFPGSLPFEVREGYTIVRVGDRFSVYLRIPYVVWRMSRTKPFDLIFEHINGVPWWSPLWSRQAVAAYVYHVVGRVFFDELAAPLAIIGVVSERLLPLVYARMPVGCLGGRPLRAFVDLGFRSERLLRIPPGVDHSVYHKTSEKSDYPLVLCLGPIKRYKRHDLAIRAFSLALRQVPDARLVITGWARGGLADELILLTRKLGVEEQVKLLGWLPYSSVVDLMSRAWCVMYTSEREGWGLGITEAGACGTAGLVVQPEAESDTVEDGQSGFVVTKSSPSAVARQLTRLISDRRVAERLGARAQSLSDQFTWDTHVRSIEVMLVHAVEDRLSKSSEYSHSVPSQRP